MSKEYIVNHFEKLLLNSPPRFLNKELKRQRNNLYRKIRYCKNFEKERERERKYRKAFPEKGKERMRKWRLENPEKQLKTNRKCDWKRYGLNMENFEEIYEKYLSTTHCELCNVLLTEDKINTKTTRTMDHSHITGEFRNVICISCNASLPRHS